MKIEQLTTALSSLYSSYGYQMYSMSKFEEYELYLRNKDFLVSDRVLTFTDTDGRLMALKPDVTLSIIKNTDDSESVNHKVFYRESVYRPGKSDQGFREITQVGLECMGRVDNYCIFEVLLLAIKSLQTVSNACVLDISHMGLLSWLMDQCALTGTARADALKAISSKNTHELRKICEGANARWEALAEVTMLSGSVKTVLPRLEEIFSGAPELKQFKTLLDALCRLGADCINVDFSVVNDMNYYNGIVFRGFIEGVPTGVLSGGQYDGLMTKMRRRGQAIGFALYPDSLERLAGSEPADEQAILLYDSAADLCVVAERVADLASKGVNVSAQPEQEGIRYGGKVYRLTGNEVVCVG